jgi:hypothetical protein
MRDAAISTSRAPDITIATRHANPTANFAIWAFGGVPCNVTWHFGSRNLYHGIVANIR